MKHLLWRVDPIASTRRYAGAEERASFALDWARRVAVRDGCLVEVTDERGVHLDVVTPKAAAAALEQS